SGLRARSLAARQAPVACLSVWPTPRMAAARSGPDRSPQVPKTLYFGHEVTGISTPGGSVVEPCPRLFHRIVEMKVLRFDGHASPTSAATVRCGRNVTRHSPPRLEG